MKHWYSFGAFGDTVVELTWSEMMKLFLGKDIHVPGTCIIISLGKAKQKSLGNAATREEQLGLD